MNFGNGIFGCGMLAPDLPDAGEGGCCMGAAVYGPNRCTWWEPFYDLEQGPLKPGEMGMRDEDVRRLRLPAELARAAGCQDGYRGDPESLDEMVIRATCSPATRASAGP